MSQGARCSLIEMIKKQFRLQIIQKKIRNNKFIEIELCQTLYNCWRISCVYVIVGFIIYSTYQAVLLMSAINPSVSRNLKSTVYIHCTNIYTNI